MMPPLNGFILTAAEMRAAEAATMAKGVSVDALMARASAAIAEAVWRFGGGRPTLILCGPGNNGGDGYVAASLLKERGLDVRVAALGDPKTEVAHRARAGWPGSVEPLDKAAPAPVLLDAVFGTGLDRPLDAGLAGQLARLRQQVDFVLAADVPSGVGSDDGADFGAISADVTIALGALKPAHLLHPSAGLCGHIICADISIAAQSALSVVARPRLSRPTAADHKYTRGLVTVISGEMGGAAALAATAAARSGAGYVVLAGALSGVVAQTPLSVVHRSIDAALVDPRTGALVIGPGLGRSDAARALLDRVLATDIPVVLDADALHLITPDQLTSRAAPCVLTPHEGEFQAAFGPLSGSKVDRARQAAKLCGAIVLLKGADTVLAAPDGRAALAAHLPFWLASAGTGDVLAGIVGAMLARGLDGFSAAEAAIWLHGRAAQIAGPWLISDDLCAALPQALEQTA
jgi:hydroxyethylthiazole kinase-like uncharacterized protein yjeF